jgi:hypothetical protein
MRQTSSKRQPLERNFARALGVDYKVIASAEDLP